MPKIKQMQVSGAIQKGFAKVKEFEEAEKSERSNIQLEHLLAIADHEQGVILQPLIYDDPDFAFWVKLDRAPVVNLISPAKELVFSSACTNDDAELKSVAPEDTKLEEFKSRMDWIKAAAGQFHKLMLKRTAYMEGELRTIAGWVDMPDKKPFTVHASNAPDVWR